MQVADVAAGEPPRREPRNDGQGRAKEPVPLQRRVDAAGAKDAGRADDAPDDRGRVKDASAWARVVVRLIRRANVLDVAEGPVEHGHLDDAGP